jgi:hypothetical protein
MSHKSGHIIISTRLAHAQTAEDTIEGSETPMERGPCIAIELPEGCTEEDCAKAARRAYRKLTE